ncbi:glycogen synthase [Corallincola luteus]|uniref:Glycogen synthase n=1 Tax=Corallincola luteus TaxID=1775177 RepID=A0ABY2AL34_9GAMM|nr:glycogen synthase [Corallincola luteus]
MYSTPLSWVQPCANKGGKVKILLVTSEYEGLVKVGGLSDFCTAFAEQLKRQGQDIRVLMPFYGRIQDEVSISHSFPIAIPLSCWQTFHAVIHCVTLKGVTLYLLEYHALYGRDGIYDDGHAAYQDNPLRYALLSHAAFDLSLALKWQPDVIHSSDWQGALVPFYRREHFAASTFFSATRTVLTIHNGAYQGRADYDWHEQLGIHPKFMVPQLFEDMGCLNPLKAGVVMADRIVTVSPSYRDELLANATSHGMAGVFNYRRADFTGVLNGVDLVEWDPASDSCLPFNYSADQPAGKQKCKQQRLKQLGLDSLEDKPLFCFIGRIAQQKGFSLLLPLLRQLLQADAMRCVVMGHGEEGFVKELEKLAAHYPHSFRYLADFSREGTHNTLAASDYMLMPSLFEPCGLSQLYAMRYGTVPIVHGVGGLKDSVTGLDALTANRSKANGYQFFEPTLKSFLATVKQAIKHYHDDPFLLQLLRRNAMSTRFDWQRVAEEYIAIYSKLVADSNNSGEHSAPLKRA